MAAWLAYLKSRLLLPEPPKGPEPAAADSTTDHRHEEAADVGQHRAQRRGGEKAEVKLQAARKNSKGWRWGGKGLDSTENLL
jgi:chromatin segregation and condensation protein Rec8/ScpA/Scc1 (kleisin family)